VLAAVSSIWRATSVSVTTMLLLEEDPDLAAPASAMSADFAFGPIESELQAAVAARAKAPTNLKERSMARIREKRCQKAPIAADEAVRQVSEHTA